MRPASAFAFLVLAALTATPAVAENIYKCVDAHGQVTYQDTPCTRREHQQVMHVPDAVPPREVPAPAATSPEPMPVPAPLPTQVAAAPPPQLYRCIGAVNDKPYISRDGHPRPYLAPLGMLGVFRDSLSDVYGGAHGARAGMSAPELAPHATSALIGSNYTWVRDRCRPLSLTETCTALHKQFDANEKKLRNAFDSDKPPLLKREAQLRRQLAGCR